MGAGLMLVLTLMPVVAILWNIWSDNIPIAVVLLFVGFSVVVCIGVVVALVGRIREIKGGEEDEASKY